MCVNFRPLLCFRKGEARSVGQMEVDIDRLAYVRSGRESDLDYHSCPNASLAIGAKIMNLSGDS